MMSNQNEDKNIVLHTKAYNSSVSVIIAMIIVVTVTLWVIPDVYLKENIVSIVIVCAIIALIMLLYAVNGYHYYTIDRNGVIRCSPFGTTTLSWEQIKQISIVWCGQYGEPNCKGIMFSKNKTDYPLTWDLTAQRYAANHWLQWFYLTHEATDYDSFNEESLISFFETQGIPYTDYTK